MGWVPWKKAVLLKVYEGAGKLDEGLIEAAVGVVGLQPEVFQDIVGLVVFALVEAREEGAVLNGQGGVRVGVPNSQPGFHAFVFFHSL
jgi:hypothetical protein